MGFRFPLSISNFFVELDYIVIFVKWFQDLKFLTELYILNSGILFREGDFLEDKFLAWLFMGRQK